VLNQINQRRTAAGLRPYPMDPALVAAAHQHNLALVAGNGCPNMVHQCPGEASMGDRISAQGVHWTAVAENVAPTLNVADNPDAIKSAALAANQGMFDNDQQSDNAHRYSLLSSTYTRIGIDAVRDNRGVLWLTEDFAN
jgi:uncharacterized protein YkwD